MNGMNDANSQVGTPSKRRADRKRVCMVALLSLALLFFISLPQVVANDSPFGNGESVKLDIKFKYGLEVKGGTLESRINMVTYNGTPAIKSTFLLNTNSFFDGIYKMRDTLISYADRALIIPLHHWRSVNEGGTHFLEEMWVQEHSKTYSKVRVIRTEKGRVKVDKELESKTPGFDLPNLLVFLRTLDYDSLSLGDVLHFSTFFGKRKTDIRCTYVGQQIVEKSRKVKYKTRKFNFDIMDEAFTESKNAIELWISDDANRVPVKLKAKLKIGAAEGLISSYKNLKHPFDAEVKQ